MHTNARGKGKGAGLPATCHVPTAGRTGDTGVCVVTSSDWFTPAEGCRRHHQSAASGKAGAPMSGVF